MIFSPDFLDLYTPFPEPFYNYALHFDLRETSVLQIPYNSYPFARIFPNKTYTSIFCEVIISISQHIVISDKVAERTQLGIRKI